MRSLTLFILAAVCGWSAEEANGIIRRLAEAQKQNDSLAGEYTYAEETAYFTYDKAGHPNKDRSETHDIIFVEGISCIPTKTARKRTTSYSWKGFRTASCRRETASRWTLVRRPGRRRN